MESESANLVGRHLLISNYTKILNIEMKQQFALQITKYVNYKHIKVKDVTISIKKSNNVV